MRTFHPVIALAATLAALLAPASSSAAFSDNFEDGNAAGWLPGTNGGLGGSGVELHNGSQMAYVAHTGNGSPFSSTANEHTLSHDFAYQAAERLSFDMQAVATSASTCCISIAHGKAGVTATFLDVFNIPLGSFGIYYATSSGILGAGEFLIDAEQHHYDASMATFASRAGLGQGAPIAKLSLTFRAYGQFVGGGNIYPNAHGTGNVWFDNVAVSAVPEPPSAEAMLAGVAALIAFVVGRRRGYTR